MKSSGRLVPIIEKEVFRGCFTEIFRFALTNRACLWTGAF